MLDLGLSASARRHYLHSLTWDHSVRVRVELMDMEDNLVDDVTDLLVSGQVDGAQDGRYRSTAAKVGLWDPSHRLGFDTRSPVHGQVFADRMLSITYGVRVWRLGEWVDVPVFRGPVTAARREGPVLAVECVGKESLVDKPVWSVVTYPKGSKITDAIRDLMRRSGEAEGNIAVPDWPNRFPADQILGRRENTWARATRFAQVMGAFLFYTGDGVARVERPSDNVVFTFRDGPSALADHGPTVLSDPRAQFATDGLVNVVRVVGQPKAAGEAAPSAVAALPTDHPLNSHRLGRRGSQRILPEWLEDRDIRSTADAQALADRTLAARSREYVHVTFDSLPVPFLTAGDMCAVQTARTVVPSFRLSEYSLPLGHDGAMSVGTRRRVHELNRRRWR